MSRRDNSDIAHIQNFDPTLWEEDDFLPEPHELVVDLRSTDRHLLTVHIDCASQFLAPTQGRLAVGVADSPFGPGHWWAANLACPTSGVFLRGPPLGVRTQLCFNPEDAQRAVLGHAIGCALWRGDRKLVERFVRGVFDRPRRILRALLRGPALSVQTEAIPGHGLSRSS
ncbi:MAG: hypothetical protein ACFB9M_19485 [Myxococcota bacterium]